MRDIKELFNAQVDHFNSLDLQSLARRRELLEKLKVVIEIHEREIIEALQEDLGKSEFETVIAETQFIVNEIQHALKKLKKWTKKKRVRSPILNFPVRSYIQPMPLGNVLIIGPWNYPFQLLMSPLVGALAAGNTAIIKPSEVSGATSRVVAKIINDNFDPRDIVVVEGGVPETTELLELPFNHIFYTGNSFVGRIVMKKAAENLCPVTLELGGKSPCLIYDVKDVRTVSDRLIWGKFFNAGQTCVAADYVLTTQELLPQLLSAFKNSMQKFYGENPIESQDYGRIINTKHFDRIMSYLNDVEVLIGGENDKEKCFIGPTIVRASWDDLIMQEEIFGPLLPILVVNDFKEAMAKVNQRARPLAAYLFTENETLKKSYSEQVISGGMCLNDTIVHLTNDKLPFGGVGESGIGGYHGAYSFKIFTHCKSIMERPLWLDLPVRYPPYGGKLKLLRWLLKFFG